MDWNSIWLDIFGTTTLFELDMGFWVSMTVVSLIVVFMNIFFWAMKPKKNR